MNPKVRLSHFERETMGLMRCNHCVMDFDLLNLTNLVSILLFLGLRFRGRQASHDVQGPMLCMYSFSSSIGYSHIFT